MKQNKLCLYGEVGRITKASRHISIMKEEHSNIVKQLYFVIGGGEVFISLRS